MNKLQKSLYFSKTINFTYTCWKIKTNLTHINKICYNKKQKRNLKIKYGDYYYD